MQIFFYFICNSATILELLIEKNYFIKTTQTHVSRFTPFLPRNFDYYTNFNIPILSNFANHHNIFSSTSEGVVSIVSGFRLLYLVGFLDFLFLSSGYYTNSLYGNLDQVVKFSCGFNPVFWHYLLFFHFSSFNFQTNLDVFLLEENWSYIFLFNKTCHHLFISVFTQCLHWKQLLQIFWFFFSLSWLINYIYAEKYLVINKIKLIKNNYCIRSFFLWQTTKC